MTLQYNWLIANFNKNFWLGVHTVNYYIQIWRDMLMEVGTVIEQFCLNTMKLHLNVIRQNYAVKRNTVYTRLYQILVTFLNFLGTLPKVVVQPPIQYTTKIFLLNFCFTPRQSMFLWQSDKNRKNGHNSATAHARCKIFCSKDAEYPSSYLLSIHYISLAVQFFK